MARAVVSLCLVLAGGPLLPAQPPTGLQARIDELIERLGKDAEAWDAAQQLERLGGLAVGSLVRAARAPGAFRERAARKKNAIYVLGRIGRQAVAALPALLEIYDFRRSTGDDHWPIARQALWAISEIAPFADGELRWEARTALNRGFRSLLLDRKVAIQRIDWRAEPSAEDVENALRSEDPVLVHAAARTVACGMLPGERALERRLGDAFEAAWPDEARAPWDPLPATYAVLPELARAVLATGTADPDTKEKALAALLWVEDPLERARAVASLKALGELGGHTLLQLVGRLREPDDGLRVQVVRALARRHAQAAFQPFQELVVSDPSAIVRTACRDAVAALDVPEPEDAETRRVLTRQRLRGAVWFGGEGQPVAELLARLAAVGDDRDVDLALRIVAVVDEADARAALEAVAALAPPRLLAGRKLEQILTRALRHRRGDALLPDAVACVARAWTQPGSAREQLLAACRHPLTAVRFAAVLALAERADGSGDPGAQEALRACHRDLAMYVHWTPEPVSEFWYEIANPGAPLLERAAVAARYLVGGAQSEQEVLLQRLAECRDEEPAATRAWAADRQAVLAWMRELQGKVGQ